MPLKKKANQILLNFYLNIWLKVTIPYLYYLFICIITKFQVFQANTNNSYSAK